LTFSSKNKIMMQYIVFTISSANVTATHITHSLFFPLGVREPQTGCQVAQATLQSKTWQTCLTARQEVRLFPTHERKDIAANLTTIKRQNI